MDSSRMTGNQFRDEDQRRVALTKSERETILGIDPSFQEIARSAYFDNYNLPCPIKVEVATRENHSKMVVLRRARHGKVEVEVRMLRALKEFGLPVPELLTGPFRNEDGTCEAVYSFLEGKNLQKLSMGSEDELQEAKQMLVKAVLTLTGASSFLAKHEVSQWVPRRSLQLEWEAIKTSDSAWSREPIFQRAMQRIGGVLTEVTTPLVFSNGDYQPGNFLANNGRITGFLDFESPAFQDPLLGIVKYPIYDLHPLSKTDVVETFLNALGFGKRDFSIRLALGCLQTLQREIPVVVGEGDRVKYREHVLAVLASALDEFA